MKRIFVAAGFAFGMLLMGATSASASSLCTIDPTVGVGTPVQYSTNISLSGGTTVYASGTSSTTTFGGGIGL
jgi:hypothetical protein